MKDMKYIMAWLLSIEMLINCNLVKEMTVTQQSGLTTCAIYHVNWILCSNVLYNWIKCITGSLATSLSPQELI